MDIIFQSGEFINDESILWQALELLTSFLAIIISAGVAIYVFKKGNENEDLKETRRLTELEEYINNIIPLLDKPIQIQISSILDFNTKLMAAIETNYTPQIVSPIFTKSIKQIDPKDLYKILVTNKKGSIEARTSLFQGFNHSIELIDQHSNSFNSAITMYITERKKFMSNWNENIVKLSELKDQLIFEYKLETTTPIDIEFLDTLDKIAALWTNFPHYDQPTTAMKYFIAPVSDLCRANDWLDNRTLTVLNLCNNCAYAYNNLVALKKFIRGVTLNEAWQLRRTKVILTQIMSTYQNLKK